MDSLNQEEKELLDSIENDEWASVDDVEEEIKRFQSYARNQLAEESIKIKLSRNDVQRIQDLANQLGQSVSTLTGDQGKMEKSTAPFYPLATNSRGNRKCLFN